MTGDPRGFENACARAAGSTEVFSKSTQRAARKVGDAGSLMTKGITLPVALAGAAAVKLASDFEQQMSAVGAAADAPAPALERLRQQALKAGADTAYSAREAAVAQTELAKGGVSAANILDGALNGALSLAAAGQLDLGEAAEITANALNLFGMKGSQAGKVADTMATAANSTTAEVSDFGMALAQSGSVAKSAGLNFNQTMVALEALAKSGIKGSDAGTSLKTALIQLIKPTQKQANLAGELGLNFLDQAGNMKSLSGISSMLRDKLGGMTKAQRTATLAQLAGTDGVRTLTALYDAGPKRLDKWAAGLDKSGTAAETAAKKQDNLKGKVEQMKGSLETLGIIVGTALIPPLTSFVKKVTEVANTVGTAFGKLPQGTQQAIVAMVGLAAAIGPVLMLGAGLVSAVSTLGGAFGALAGMVGVAAGPLLAIVAAVVAVGAALVYAYKTSASFRASVQQAVATLAPAFQNLVNTVKPAIAGLIAALKPLAQALGPVLGFAIKLAVPVIKSAINAITQALSGFVTFVTGIVRLVTAILTGDFSGMWDAVKQIFSGALQTIIGLAKLQLITGLGVVGKLATRALSVAFRAGVGLIKSAVMLIGRAAIAGLKIWVGAHRAVGALLVRAVVSAVRAALGAMKSAATAVARGAISGFKSVVGQAVSVGRAIVQGMINGIGQLAGSLINAAKNLGKEALNAAKGVLGIKSPSREMQEVGKNFSKGFEVGIASKSNDVKGTVAKSFKDAVKDVKKKLQDIAKSAAATFRATREKAIDTTLENTLAQYDTSLAGQLFRQRKGIGADPRLAELAGLQGAKDSADRAAQDKELSDAHDAATKNQTSALDQQAKAEAALTAAQQLGNDRLIAAAQRRYDLAKQRAQATATEVAAVEAQQKQLAADRRIAEIEAELETARTIAQDSADAQKEGLDKEEEDFRASLASKLLAEQEQLAARKESYAKFAKDVQAILDASGIAGLDLDLSKSAKSDLSHPIKKKKKKKKAAGGLTMSRLGEVTRVGELGPEDLYLPHGARVVQASQSSRGGAGAGGPLIGEVNIYEAGKLDELALAQQLGFQFATRAR